MKPLAAIAFAAIASFITAGGALAQEHIAVANVPFNFNVGDKVLPPGTYTLRSPAPGIILIENREKTASTMTTAYHDANEVRSAGELVFSRYGNQYFLKEVLCPDASISAALPTSKQEKRTRMLEAVVPGRSEVLLALK
jgi:hypothetical protein